MHSLNIYYRLAAQINLTISNFDKILWIIIYGGKFFLTTNTHKHTQWLTRNVNGDFFFIIDISPLRSSVENWYYPIAVQLNKHSCHFYIYTESTMHTRITNRIPVAFTVRATRNTHQYTPIHSYIHSCTWYSTWYTAPVLMKQWKNNQQQQQRNKEGILSYDSV